jgi:hypothetical protein
MDHMQGRERDKILLGAASLADGFPNACDERRVTNLLLNL